MTRLNISFNAHVPTLHPSILMTLLSVLSVLRLFGISVTLAPPNLTDLNPSHMLATLSPLLSDEAKKALDIPDLAPNHIITTLPPVLSDEAKNALDKASINPANAIASLTPVLTSDASRTLDQANINPTEAIKSVAPVLSAEIHSKTSDQAVTDSTAAVGLAGPLRAEALAALAEAATEGISSAGAAPSGATGEEVGVASGDTAGAMTMAMHRYLCAQVAGGGLSKEGALAAHAALYDVVVPSSPMLMM